MHDAEHRPRDGGAFGERLELEADVTFPLLAPFIDQVTAAVGEAAAVTRVLDLGSGPGAAAVALALRFPNATVTAVDREEGLLERLPGRAARFGVEARVTATVADLEGSLHHVAPPESVDVAWASMVLHHLEDPAGALGRIRRLLRPGGVLAVVEMRRLFGTLPAGFDVGSDGFGERLAAAVRAGLEAHLPPGAMTRDWPALLVAAGFEVLVHRELEARLAAPLDPLAARLALEELRGSARRVAGLEPRDRKLLDALADPSDPRCVLHRQDFTYDLSRTVLVGRRR